MPSGLQGLPVELLYELQLYALSDALPYTSRHVRDVFNSAPPSFRAQYLIGRVSSGIPTETPEIYTKALRYPICDLNVMKTVCGRLPGGRNFDNSVKCDLPRRMFRSLAPKPGASRWDEREEPLPFLRYLIESPKVPTLNVNAHEGYALTKAVHAKFIPLIRFLLHCGASPQCKNDLAVRVAIRQKDLSLVKLLIERDGSQVGLNQDVQAKNNKGKNKRRKLEDRVEVNRDMLKTAVKCDARDIVEYLTREKGCVPDMQTLHMMMK